MDHSFSVLSSKTIPRTAGFSSIQVILIPLGNLPQDLHSTHRGLRDDGYIICWDGYLATLEEAMVIASLWADTTALYVKGLGDFDTIANILREF